MANYVATARSNYFRVKDTDEFTRIVGIVAPDISIHKGESDQPDGSVCLLADGGDGPWPYIDLEHLDTDDDDLDVTDAEREALENGENPFPGVTESIVDLVAEHLVGGDVAVFMEAGHEKMRSVSGYAVAVNSAGETRGVNLADIYKMAADLGSTVTAAEF